MSYDQIKNAVHAEGLDAFMKKVLALMDEGLSKTTIAERLSLSYSTLTNRIYKWEKINGTTTRRSNRGRKSQKAA